MRCNRCGGELTTGDGGTNDGLCATCRNNPPFVAPMTGWICPVCGRGNAPFTSSCPCVPPPPMYPTCGGSNG